MPVRPKKHLGQHFLRDENIAKKIARSLSLDGYGNVLEVGPGTGILTKFLLDLDVGLKLVEIDSESVRFLHDNFPLLRRSIIEADFLKLDLTEVFENKPFAVIGNFPYNISSQIVFKVLNYREIVPEFSGMFQKEVAERICEKPGSKAYGILSVLVQAFYDTEYLFSVPPQVFDPPPKVDSGVLRLKRKTRFHLECDESLFFKVVKAAFNQRRKTLRNSLKMFQLTESLKANVIFGKRPEQLSVEEFIQLVELIEKNPG